MLLLLLLLLAHPRDDSHLHQSSVTRSPAISQCCCDTASRTIAIVWRQMRPTVADVLYVCLSVTARSGAETDERIKMLFGMCTWLGTRNGVLDGGSDAPGRRGSFGGISQPVVKYGEYPVCSPYSQRCSVGGIGDAAVCCQCRGSLFVFGSSCRRSQDSSGSTLASTFSDGLVGFLPGHWEKPAKTLEFILHFTVLMSCLY